MVSLNTVYEDDYHSGDVDHRGVRIPLHQIGASYYRVHSELSAIIYCPFRVHKKVDFYPTTVLMFFPLSNFDGGFSFSKPVSQKVGCHFSFYRFATASIILQKCIGHFPLTLLADCVSFVSLALPVRDIF